MAAARKHRIRHPIGCPEIMMDCKIINEGLLRRQPILTLDGFTRIVPERRGYYACDFFAV